jgi:hypothetical protein
MAGDDLEDDFGSAPLSEDEREDQDSASVDEVDLPTQDDVAKKRKRREKLKERKAKV